MSDALRFASAISDELDTADALDETLAELRQQLDGPAELALVFATSHHRRAFESIPPRIRREIGADIVLGATAGGVIGPGHELERRGGLSILAAQLPGVTLHPFTHADLDWPASQDDPAALRRAIAGTNASSDPAVVILLADPFSTPMVKLMPAINDALPGVPVIGGLASGASQPGNNRLFFGDQVMREGAVGVAIGGAIRAHCTVSQGCRAIGEPWIITRARHNVIQEIGRRPVLAVLEEMASAMDEPERRQLEQGIFIGRVINEYQDRFGRGDFLIRNIIGADREHGYVAVADLVRVGQTIQFHVRDPQTAEEDLRLLMESQKLHGPAAGALLCTCSGRGSAMFDQPHTESHIIRQALGAAPLAGFFAAGEIGPIGTQNFVHGFTASLAVFRPAED